MRAPAQPRRILHAWIVALALAAGCAPTTPVADTSTPKLDVVWVASAPEVIRAMLETAKVGPGDVVYDLGCGNGEIVIAAAKLYGARAVGVDLDPARIRWSRSICCPSSTRGFAPSSSASSVPAPGSCPTTSASATGYPSAPSRYR
jgi:SAM-dependent methyltransferase